MPSGLAKSVCPYVSSSVPKMQIQAGTNCWAIMGFIIVHGQSIMEHTVGQQLNTGVHIVSKT
jgi:hypothetical protein